MYNGGIVQEFKYFVPSVCCVQFTLLSVSSPLVVKQAGDYLPITGGHQGNQASTTLSLEKFVIPCLYIKGTFKGNMFNCSVE